MTAFTARPLTTNLLQNLVNQTAHDFSVGQIVIYNGSWVLANASTAAECAGSWIVSFVQDANNFIVTQEGWVNNLDPAFFDADSITPGIQYYVSVTNDGFFTSVQPNGSGQIVLPCLVCDTTTSGYFYGGSGIVVSGGGSSFIWSIVSVNTAMDANHGYLTSTGGSINLALPTSIAVGDIVRVSNLLGTFVITQAAGQVVSLGNEVTTTGTGGSITSTHVGDSLEIICVNANVDFQVLSSMGNLTVA